MQLDVILVRAGDRQIISRAEEKSDAGGNFKIDLTLSKGEVPPVTIQSISLVRGELNIDLLDVVLLEKALLFQ